MSSGHDDPDESKPLVAQASPRACLLDVAVVWVKKAETGSTTWVNTVSESQMKAYELKKRLSPVSAAVKWSLLLIAIVDTPTYCLNDVEHCPGTAYAQRIGLRSSGVPSLPPGLTNDVCIVLWAYLLFHFMLRRRAFGAAHVTTWPRAIATLLVVISLVDCVWAVFNRSGMPFLSTFRVSRLFRPIVFLLLTKSLRDAAGRLMSAIPGFIDVLLSLLLCIIFFSWTGLVLFVGSDEGHDHFKSWSSAIASLWTLFTTANNPDVWLPGYAVNKVSFLFFLVFILISLYLLSNVLLAAVYDAYKEQLKSMIRSFYANRNTCIKNAFDLLKNDQGFIPLETWLDFFPHLCGQFGLDAVAHNKARAKEIFTALDKDGENGLDLQEFSAVLTVMADSDTYIRRGAPPKPAELSDAMQWFHRVAKRGVTICGVKVLSWENFVDIVIFFDVLLVLVQTMRLIQLGERTDLVLLDNTATFWALFALSTFYAVVLVVKMRLGGLEAFWNVKPVKNRFDFFNVFPCFALEVAALVHDLLTPGDGHHEAPWLMRMIMLLHLMRMLRLLRHVRPLRYIANFVVQLAPTYYRMGMLLILVYYVYALIGEQWFGGRIYSSNPALQGTAFATNGYWDMNFNDFVASMVTMFVIMVVNNWTVITAGYVTASGSRWAVAFFVSFFVVTNLIVLNILMALILECSSTLRGEIDVVEDDEEAPKRKARMTYEETLRKVLMGEGEHGDSSPGSLNSRDSASSLEGAGLTPRDERPAGRYGAVGYWARRRSA